MIHKFVTNVPSAITLKAPGEEVQGDYGPQVKYWIEIDGQNATWYATPYVSEFLDRIKFQSGTLALVEREGSNAKGWVARVNGTQYNSWESSKPSPEPVFSVQEEEEIPFANVPHTADLPEAVQDPTEAIAALMLRAVELSCDIWSTVEGATTENVEDCAISMFINFTQQRIEATPSQIAALRGLQRGPDPTD